MIKSFAHKGLARFFFTGSKRGIQAQHAQKLADILDLLDAAVTVTDMNFPGSNLHQLRGKQRGLWAVSVSGNWRVIFRFQNAEAFDVDYLDYH